MVVVQFEPSEWVPVLKLGVLGRLVLAAVLGGLIGLEREISAKPAGLRTNLLICVGAALLTEISISLATLANVANEAQAVEFRADPARIAAQIVTGIGFLGAGTILQSRGHVTGLTTAATIWVVAAIGMAVGSRAYVEAIGATVLVYLALVLLEKLEDAVLRRRNHFRYTLVLDPEPALADDVTEVFRSRGMNVRNISVDRGLEHFDLTLDVAGTVDRHGEVMQVLLAREGVRRLNRSP